VFKLCLFILEKTDLYSSQINKKMEKRFFSAYFYTLSFFLFYSSDWSWFEDKDNNPKVSYSR